MARLAIAVLTMMILTSIRVAASHYLYGLHEAVQAM